MEEKEKERKEGTKSTKIPVRLLTRIVVTVTIDTTIAVLTPKVETPIDSGIDLSIRIDNLRVFINKTLSIESLVNQLLIKRSCLSISIDSR